MAQPQWLPFLALAVALTLLILVFTRRSTRRLEETGRVERIPTRAMHLNVVLTQGIVTAVLLGAVWLCSIPMSALGAAPSDLGLSAVGLGAGFGVCCWTGNELSTTVADILGFPYDQQIRELLAPESGPGWVVLFGCVLPVIALSEELLFRGVLVGGFTAATGISPVVFVAGSSVAFAAGHSAQGRLGILVTGLLGFVLAAGYVVSGSLLLVIVAHYLINGLEFLVHTNRETATSSSGR